MHGEESSQGSKMVTTPVEEPSSEDEAPLLVVRHPLPPHPGRTPHPGARARPPP